MAASRPGGQHVEVSPVADHLAAVVAHVTGPAGQGDPRAAAASLAAAIERTGGQIGTDHPQILAATRVLAALRRHLGELPEARSLLENALAAGQFTRGEQDPVMLGLAYDLAFVAHELENRHEARRNFDRIRRHGPAVLGPDHEYVLVARRYLGDATAVAPAAPPVPVPAAAAPAPAPPAPAPPAPAPPAPVPPPAAARPVAPPPAAPPPAARGARPVPAAPPPAAAPIGTPLSAMATPVQTAPTVGASRSGGAPRAQELDEARLVGPAGAPSAPSTGRVPVPPHPAPPIPGPRHSAPAPPEPATAAAQPPTTGTVRVPASSRGETRISPVAAAKIEAAAGLRQPTEPQPLTPASTPTLTKQPAAPVRSEPQPARAPAPAPTPERLDSGGTQRVAPAPAPAQPRRQPELLVPLRPVPAHRPAGAAPARRQRSRVPLILLSAVLAFAILGGSAALVIVFLSSDPRQDPPPAAPSATPEAIRLTLDDQGATVTLSWTDPSSGQVPFAVSYGRADGPADRTEPVPAATTSLTVRQLNPALDYCFTVTVGDSTAGVASSPTVCTSRTARPSR